MASDPEQDHVPWHVFETQGPIPSQTAKDLAIYFESRTIYRDDFRWIVDSLLSARSRLAEAERLLRESFAPGTNGGPLCPRCGYEGYDGAKKGHYPDCALARWLEGGSK